MKDIRSKIDAYKRKFFLDRIVRSILWFIIIWTSYYLIISTLEYFFWLSPKIRTTLFVIMWLFTFLTLVVYIIYPFLQSIGLFHPKTDDEAALEIGDKIPSVKDKLINYLQLQSMARSMPNNPWYIRGARQKEQSMNSIEFADAIDIKKNNRKTLKYLGIVASVLVLIMLIYPALIMDSAERIWNPTEEFEPVAPFTFQLHQNSLVAIEGEALDIMVTLEGEELPEELEILIGDERFEMQALEANTFRYHLPRVAHKFSFQFESAPYHSQLWSITPIQKIDVNSLKLYVDYPSHIGMKDRYISTIGDVQVPEGSKLTWSINSDQIESAYALIGNSYFPFAKYQTGYLFSFVPSRDTSLSFTLAQKGLKLGDTLTTHISVVQDQSPTLTVTQKVDSTDPAFVVLTGEAADDHSLSSVLLVMNILNQNGKLIRTKSHGIKLDRHNYTTINKLIDFYKMNLPTGARVQYYVQATDNDVVHGGKTVTSQRFEYRTPTREELQVIEKNNTKEAIDALSNGQSNAQKSTELLEESKKDLLSKSEFSFENKQSFERLQKANEQIKENLEDFKKKMQKQEEYHKDMENESLKEEEKQLEKLADQLLQDKIQKQLERIEELMKKLEKNQANVNEVEQIQQEQKNIENELERLEELAKRLEMQVKMDQLADKVDSAAVEELRMSTNIQKAPQNNQNLDQERKNQKKLLDDIDKEMKDLKDKNEDLQSPFSMDKIQEEMKKAMSNIQHSDQERSQNKMSKSSKSSEDANKNLMNMSEMLQDMANGDDMEELEEDIAAMRRLLQNLLKISFNQETLLKSTNQLRANSPQYVTLSKKQNEIRKQVHLIKDSLKKLAMKDIRNGARINEEVEALLTGLDQTLDDFQERQKSSVVKTQQYNMMHVNNLTLFFGEGLNKSMAKLNSQKQKKSQGQSSCKNPGGKNPSNETSQSGKLRDIITQQQKLGNQMQQMQAAMQRQGQQKGKEGQPKPGDDAKKSGRDGQRGQNSEELARLAKAQEDLKQRILDLNAELKKNNQGLNELNDIAKQQEKNEEEIINKRISNQLLARQQEIITKMLKSEEAIRQQEQGEKREAEKAQSAYSRSIPPSLLPYLQTKNKSNEKYKSLPPDMNEYYQEMIQKYFQNLQ